MSYHQKKSCTYCGWITHDVEWRPLLEEYSCDDCDRELRVRNIRAAVGGRPKLGRAKRAKADQELPLVVDSSQLSLFDDLYVEQERRRALQARIEGWAF